MKRKVLTGIMLLLSVMLVSACAAEQEVSFSAVVDEVYESSLMVSVTDGADFDRASVGITDDTEIVDAEDRNIDIKEVKMGTKLKVWVKGGVRESYPVQVTAKKIRLEYEEEPSSQPAGEYKSLTPEQAKARLDSGDELILLDVRRPDENAQQRIPSGTLLPDYDIAQQAQSVLPDKDAEILVYCRSGRRSKAAAEQLLDMGYTNVYDMGGILDWPYETESD